MMPTCTASQLANERGGELFMLLIADCGRKELRARKAAAVEAIIDVLEEATGREMVAEPGEVRVPPKKWERLVAEQTEAKRRAQERMGA